VNVLVHDLLDVAADGRLGVDDLPHVQLEEYGRLPGVVESDEAYLELLVREETTPEGAHEETHRAARKEGGKLLLGGLQQKGVALTTFGVENV
jgi:hypothetical protein